MDLNHLYISIAYIHKMRSVPACIDSSHLECQSCMWCKAPLTVVLNSYQSIKTKLKQLCSLKKKGALKKSRDWKKVWFRLGLNPQLSWLTTVCLCWFERNVPQLFPAFSTPRTNESGYPLAITIVEFPDDVRLISLKSCFVSMRAWNAK